MRKIIAGSLLVLVAYSVVAQKSKQTERKVYLTQIKAAESLLRLNETGEAKKMLNEIDSSVRGFKWQLSVRMARSYYQDLQTEQKSSGIL